MWNDFKKFIFKGNIVDMAIGVIIGGAFGKIVTSLVNDIIMPLIGLITGKIKFENLFIVLGGGEYDTIEAAQAAGVSTLNYGLFITAVVDFLIVAVCIFLAVRQMTKIHNKFAKKKDPAPPTVKDCPYCKTSIHIDAVKCPNCTSEQPEPEKKADEAK